MPQLNKPAAEAYLAEHPTRCQEHLKCPNMATGITVESCSCCEEFGTPSCQPK